MPAYDSYTGEEIDMRPPHVKLAAAESEYRELLADEQHEAAVHALVARKALTRIVFGDAHPRCVHQRQYAHNYHQQHNHNLHHRYHYYHHYHHCHDQLFWLLLTGND